MKHLTRGRRLEAAATVSLTCTLAGELSDAITFSVT